MPTPREYRQLRFERPSGASELLLVRHGESEPAVFGRPFPLVDGHGDPALSAEGRAQAALVCRRLADQGLDAVYVTSLRRTLETAEPLARRLGLEPVVERDLREVFLGDWEGGLFRRKVAEGDPVARRMYEEQRYDVIPGAEPASEFSRRVSGAVRRMAVNHPDQRVAVFCHGGTIGEILAQATGARPFAFTGCDNASLSHLVVMPGRWQLRLFNDTSHLEQGPPTGAAPLT
ncbi:MAG TPA: histidine phosphatase family protein [Acidimicrobiales bacterium]|nr:histidine phosphatase family protein [Acidimicrobiales bacterium]